MRSRTVTPGVTVPPEVVARVRAYLEGRAAAAPAGDPFAALTYCEQIADTVDPGGQWLKNRAWSTALFDAMDQIADEDAAAGRPILTALVVRKGTREVNSGFYDRAATALAGYSDHEWWVGQVAACVGYYRLRAQVLAAVS